jgi:hypothetical protein
MRRKRTGASQWVLLVSGPILSLIAFIAAYYVDPLNFGHHAPLAAVPAFLLSIVILLVSHNIASFRELERASSDSDRIYEAVKDYLHVTKVGSYRRRRQPGIPECLYEPDEAIVVETSDLRAIAEVPPK